MKNEMLHSSSSAQLSMQDSTKKKTAKSRLLAWLGIGLCGLCCSLPIIGALAGIIFFTAIAAYLEMIAILALGMAGVFFAVAYFQKKKKSSQSTCDTSCDVDCGCNPASDTKGKC